MGWIQRSFSKLTNSGAPYVEESNTFDSDQRVTVKDLLRFMEKQGEQNSLLIQSVLQSNVAQSETLKCYIDLFKPKTVESTTLSEREAKRSAREDVREDEWEGINTPSMFNELAGYSNGVPPEPEEF